MAEVKTTEGKKFTKEEMENVSKIKEKYNEITVRFGQLQIEQNVIDEQRERVNTEYKSVRKLEVEFVKELSDKYGAGKLDLDTGVFIPS
jgi:intein-encoded DNA endonuclease-like protein